MISKNGDESQTIIQELFTGGTSVNVMYVRREHHGLVVGDVRFFRIPSNRMMIDGLWWLQSARQSAEVPTAWWSMGIGLKEHPRWTSPNCGCCIYRFFGKGKPIWTHLKGSNTMEQQIDTTHHNYYMIIFNSSHSYIISSIYYITILSFLIIVT